MAITITEGPRRIVGGNIPYKDLHVASVVDEQDQASGRRTPRHHPSGAIAADVGRMLSFGELQSHRREVDWKLRCRAPALHAGNARGP